VASFTLEALVTSLDAVPLGFLDLPGLVPVAAADDAGNLLSNADGAGGGLGVACIEPVVFKIMAAAVYFVPASKTVLVLLRAPPVRHARDAVCEALLVFAAPFARTVLVSGMDATQRRGAQLASPPFRFLATTAAGTAACEAVGWLPLERHEPTKNHPEGVFIPHGGLARTFYRAALARALPLTVLVAFGLAGDTLSTAGLLGALSLRVFVYVLVEELY
jgi:hypothetical protein